MAPLIDALWSATASPAALGSEEAALADASSDIEGPRDRDSGSVGEVDV
jgi:hypothetical protein